MESVWFKLREAATVKSAAQQHIPATSLSLLKRHGSGESLKHLKSVILNQCRVESVNPDRAALLRDGLRAEGIRLCGK